MTSQEEPVNFTQKDARTQDFQKISMSTEVFYPQPNSSLIKRKRHRSGFSGCKTATYNCSNIHVQQNMHYQLLDVRPASLNHGWN